MTMWQARISTSHIVWNGIRKGSGMEIHVGFGVLGMLGAPGGFWRGREWNELLRRKQKIDS